MSRVMVTGGAGFIGSHYVRGLLTGDLSAYRDHEVVVVDKLTYAGNRANLRPVWGSARLTFVQADICDAPLLTGLLRDVDVLVHFAAETHVDRSIADGAEVVRTNVLGTQTVLQCALRAGVGKVVHVSTDEVYGSISSGSWPESHPLAPNSPYAASKAAADLIARAYYRTHGLPVCVTRCSNNYGPYQFPEKVIPLFTTNLLDGETVPLYGDGHHVRDWLHVDDHCRGVQLVVESGRPGEVYNIGGGTELTNRHLTERLLKLTGADWSMVRTVPDREGHDRRYALDWTKMADELGYRPRHSFDEGLAETVCWYRRNRQWWEPLKRPSVPLLS